MGYTRSSPLADLPARSACDRPRRTISDDLGPRRRLRRRARGAPSRVRVRPGVTARGRKPAAALGRVLVFAGRAGRSRWRSCSACQPHWQGPRPCRSPPSASVPPSLRTPGPRFRRFASPGLADGRRRAAAASVCPARPLRARRTRKLAASRSRAACRAWSWGTWSGPSRSRRTCSSKARPESEDPAEATRKSSRSAWRAHGPAAQDDALRHAGPRRDTAEELTGRVSHAHAAGRQARCESARTIATTRPGPARRRGASSASPARRTGPRPDLRRRGRRHLLLPQESRRDT